MGVEFWLSTNRAAARSCDCDRSCDNGAIVGSFAAEDKQEVNVRRLCSFQSGRTSASLDDRTSVEQTVCVIQTYYRSLDRRFETTCLANRQQL